MKILYIDDDRTVPIHRTLVTDSASDLKSDTGISLRYDRDV